MGKNTKEVAPSKQTDFNKELNCLRLLAAELIEMRNGDPHFDNELRDLEQRYDKLVLIRGAVYPSAQNGVVATMSNLKQKISGLRDRQFMQNAGK